VTPVDPPERDRATPGNIALLSEYWHGLAAGATPERTQFHIEDVQPLLPYLILCDFEFDPFRLRYRLSGTKVDEMTSMNLAGRYLDEFLGGAYDNVVRDMLGYYEEISRTGRPHVFYYPFAGDNPKRKVIWAGLFPLKVDGVIAQCVSIEDYGDYNESEDGILGPLKPGTRRDWSRLHR
jgi:hypothetical protein